ncbi:endolytic transglycosylase MltG [Gammaproteobacteria bacterium]|nr:endolytic transglycosylase MltG [Gammaproteobacteria bacterium]MDB3915714.1 endolytic transglycosylase MltG [Gammaproteobacteria bacterium]
MKTLFYINLIIIFTISIVGPYHAFINFEPAKDEYIVVKQGESMTRTLDNLVKSNILDTIFFKVFLAIENIDSFQAGKYKVEEKNLQEIFLNLSQGNTSTHKLVIKDGANIYDVQKELENSFLDIDCFNLNCIKRQTPFKEGILYPDTYFYKDSMKASSLLQASHDRLFNTVSKLWLNKPPNNPLKNINEAIILASIIEKEAGNNQEKTLIAGVFLKRLTLGMRLQADPTIIYGLLPNFDGDIKKSDILNKNNLYNTYMIKGLPPTPISMASLSSIEAAINSVPGNYLYFVANSKTSHYFSKTYKEHLEMINILGLNK